jgi:hypothetical protein
LASDPSAQLDLDLPDLDTDGARRFLRDPPVSKETLYRLARRGEIDGHLLAGCRIWRRPSLRAYKQRQIAKGPQFDPAPTGKRRRGRRPKPRLEQESSATNAR